jgi:hypothetical protein
MHVVTIDRVWIEDLIYWTSLIHTTCDCTSQTAVSHKLVPPVTLLLTLENPWPTTSFDFSVIQSFKVKIILLLMVSRPVCLGVRPPSGASDQLFFL